MTITKEQIADLRVGDVVRLTCGQWDDGAYIEGPVHTFRRDPEGHLWVGGLSLHNLTRFDSSGQWTLEVIRRVPPFYVNARRGPVVGDVAHTKESARGEGDFPGIPNGPWFRTMEGWVSTLGKPIMGDMPPEGNVLLIDGTTRQVVPDATRFATVATSEER